MKLKNTFLALALAGASLAIPALADSTMMQVNVPFAFIAGGKKMPAGTYTVRVSDSGQVLVVMGAGESSMVTGVPTSEPAGELKPQLVFKRYGAEQYLIGVQAAQIGSRSLPVHLLQ